ncbi:putative P-loop containing nucleoside triphosphate hydrolase protein [Seiridium cardinale]|uniref:P-loop containing nucleoside triphosphate hydrolase protein n=1 Tax=Seiridium cardinale TaxID=138064 RepID=A0ABR2XN12_9PEZI
MEGTRGGPGTSDTEAGGGPAKDRTLSIAPASGVESEKTTNQKVTTGSGLGITPLAMDEKKVDDQLPNMPGPVGRDAGFAVLTEDEEQVLQTQLRSLDVTGSFFKLYRYADIWDYLITAISVPCAIAAGAALPLLSVLFGQLATAFQLVANDAIMYDDFMSRLTQNVLFYVYIGVAEFGVIYISTAGFTYTGERIAQKIREEYLRAILRQNIGYFENLGAGEITTRITADTNLIQDGISQKVGLTLTAVATFVSSIIIAYIIDWKLALICTPSILCLVGAMSFGYRFVVKFTSRALHSYGIGAGVAGELISSIRTVTAFGNHERLAEQYDMHLRAAERYGVRMQIIQAVMGSSLGPIMYMTQGLALWQGSRYLVEGEIRVGQILTVSMAIINGSFSLGSLAPNAQAFTSAVAASAKIYSTIDRQSPLDPSSKEGRTLDHIEGSVELRNIKHVYPSRPEAAVLDGVSLIFPAGRTTALVGPSGSGKSTVVSLIERFYNPVRGEIFLDGHNIQSLNLRWLRQQMSLVSQEPILFSTTIFENIKFGLIGTPFEKEPDDKLHELIEKAAKMANAHNFITSLPRGYQTPVGEQGFLLSGGQKQRVAIARAVVSDPKILLLDEATSALDSKSEAVVQAALEKAAEGRTTIVIAHRLSTIKSAHNIVVLADGDIAEQGTHDELLNANGMYSKLVKAQRLHEDNSAQAMEEEEEEDTTANREAADDFVSTQKVSDDDLTEKSERIDETPTGLPEPQGSKQSHLGTLLSLIKFIASFNRPELKMMIIGIVFVVISGGGQPAQSLVYSKAIATLSLASNLHDQIRHETNLWALLLLVLGIVTWFTNSVHLIIFGVGSEKMIRRARDQAFRTMLRQDISFFDRDENSTGALLSFLSTETKHLAGISGVTLSTILILVTWLSAALVIALALGWKLALVCIAIVPLVLCCGFYRVSMLANFQAHSKQAYEASASYACEVISAIRTVASLCREDHVLATYHRQLALQRRASLFPSLKSSLFYALSQGVYFLSTSLAFWYGGSLLGKHEYSIFQFFVCFTQIIFSVNAAGSIFSNAPDMAKAKSAAADFKQLFARTPAIDVWSDEGEKIKSAEGTIEFRNVHFRYPTRPAQKVLSGLSFTVKPGQYAALVGASGCGKSTTIALIERFYDVLSGGIYVDGKNISSLNVNSYRSHLALVSQEPVLYQGTIRENILLGSHASEVTEEAIIRACKESNIYDLVLSLPDGLNTMVGSKGNMVSGGQKQRIAIARALLRNPKVLLLDEATSALDSESEEVVQTALDAAARGRTTIAVAHRLSTIQKADIIFVLDQGHVVESGTHHELIRSRGRYFELVKRQSVDRSS